MWLSGLYHFGRLLDFLLISPSTCRMRPSARNWPDKPKKTFSTQPALQPILSLCIRAQDMYAVKPPTHGHAITYREIYGDSACTSTSSRLSSPRAPSNQRLPPFKAFPFCKRHNTIIHSMILRTFELLNHLNFLRILDRI